VLAGRKNKGALAYKELAQALIKHWKSGKPLPTFAVEV
jgi:chromosome partitioning protein